MNSENLYFIKISGAIRDEKRKEFQQTIQFIFNHLPSECLGRSLALDVHISDLYHLYLLWSSESSLLNFKKSDEFELLKVAYKTLGAYKETLSGRKSDLTLFDLNYLDINPSEI